MNPENVSFVELEHWLVRTPIIAEVHPLLPLCLSAETQIITDARELIQRLDDRSDSVRGQLLIADRSPDVRSRFPTFRSIEHPPIDAINRNVANHLQYARSHLVNSRTVAQNIKADVARHSADIVVLFLVDGLCYGDVLGWKCASLQPCFVDGPSMTYRFVEDEDRLLNSEVGFASVINRPSIFSRLYEMGYTYARGFTYWTPGSNEIADYMFDGIPYRRVANFDSILRSIEGEAFPPGSFLQIVREGLDGLAHGKRELSRLEIESAIDAIRQDIDRLLSALGKRDRTVSLYLTADHGVLWKTEHSWELIDQVKGNHPRFSEHRPPDTILDKAVRIVCAEKPYYLWRYPCLGVKIPINDSGVHGGLSFQESFVPFAIFRE